MPVENLRSDLVTSGWGDNGVDPAKAGGRLIVAAGIILNAAGGSAGSTYELIGLPADCILLSGTGFKVDTWGYAQVMIGTIDDTDALLDVARSAATTQSPVVKFAAASHGKPLWQLLGLAARPSDNLITLYAHAAAGATGAGSMPFEIHYLYR